MSVLLDDDDEAVPGLLPDGRPDPAYPASLGILPAPLGRRAAAFALDAAFFLVLLLPIFLGAVPRVFGMLAEGRDLTLLPSHPDFLVTLIFYLVGQGLVTIFTIVQLVLHGTKGVTAGKAIMGIRSVNVVTLGKPGFWWIVLRALVLSAAFTVIPYLGAVPFLLSPLWDPEKRGRGWLDRIGRTWLIDVKRGLNPYDQRALRLARRALSAPAVAGAVELPSLATGTAWAGPTFVPAGRSSSGVVSLSHPEAVPEAWEPPPISAVPTSAAPSSAAPTSPSAPPAAAPVRPAAVPAPVPAERTARARSATIVFNDGLRFDIDGDTLLGRNPTAAAGAERTRLLLVDDPERQLSKTHLALGIDDAGVWISDQGSSNGTFITDADGRTDPLVPFVKTPIAAGAVIALGDRTFVVTPKDAT